MAPAAFHRGQLVYISTPDTSRYLQLADSLAHGDGFVRPSGERSLDNPWQPEAFRTPGYPLFLASILGLTRGHIGAVLAVQIAIDVIAVWLCFVLAARLLG